MKKSIKKELDIITITLSVHNEVVRQDEKFGDQTQKPSVTTGPAFDGSTWRYDYADYEIPCEARAKNNCKIAHERGRGSWMHVAVEELAEVLEAKTPEERRKELVQLAAVCVNWIHAIDNGGAR